MVAAYLIAENFKKFGYQDKVKTTWLIAITFTVALFATIFFVPGVQKLPQYIIPLIYAAITQALVQKFQGSLIKDHIAKGGSTYTVWRSVWIGLVGAAILIAIILVIIFLLNKPVIN